MRRSSSKAAGQPQLTLLAFFCALCLAAQKAVRCSPKPTLDRQDRLSNRLPCSDAYIQPSLQHPPHCCSHISYAAFLSSFHVSAIYLNILSSN